MRKKLQHIKVKDYRDPWVNRLAVVEAMFQQMGENERSAVLGWINSKYANPVGALVGQ